MKLTFFRTKIIITAVVFLTLSLFIFSSCVEVSNHSEPPYPSTSKQANAISEPNSSSGSMSSNSSHGVISSISNSSSSESNSDSVSVPEYIDTLFTADTFIKYCNASEEPNYESVYKFDKNGTVTYSYNMWEGFNQSSAKYFIRKFRSGKYQILIYSDSKNKAEVLFTVYNNKTISADAAASFISENEFNQIYAFHTEWNKQAAEYKDE